MQLICKYTNKNGVFNEVGFFLYYCQHIITLTKSGISYQIQWDIPHKINF